MGRLRLLSDQTDHPLEPRTLIGRAPTCGVRLADAKVSGEHATIAWTPTGWRIRDLGSRNGTFVEGQRLAVGVDTPVVVGTRIAFGSDAMVLECVDIAPPSPRAIGPDGSVVEAADSLLFLPDAEHPQACIYWRDEQWWVDAGSEPTPAPPTLLVDGLTWVLELPAILGATQTRRHAVAHLALDLKVSSDEEFVRTEVIIDGVSRVLPYRAHHYLLVVLARERLADGAGWLDAEQLARMMGLSRQALNLQIFRIRKDFEKLGIENPADVIERRASSQVRINIARLTVGPLPD